MWHCLNRHVASKPGLQKMKAHQRGWAAYTLPNTQNPDSGPWTRPRGSSAVTRAKPVAAVFSLPEAKSLQTTERGRHRGCNPSTFSDPWLAEHSGPIPDAHRPQQGACCEELEWLFSSPTLRGKWQPALPISHTGPALKRNALLPKASCTPGIVNFNG